VFVATGTFLPVNHLVRNSDANVHPEEFKEVKLLSNTFTSIIIPTVPLRGLCTMSLIRLPVIKQLRKQRRFA
jgi:hypothetical protein